MRFYAGIGSRNTPTDVLSLMFHVAKHLAGEGFTLRSGGAQGADKAFFDGAEAKELYLPWVGYNNHYICQSSEPNQPAFALAKKRLDIPRIVKDGPDRPSHWSYLKQGGRKMHARNMQIILGENLEDPVNFVLCWTKGGVPTGGTATGINLATDSNIVVYNLAKSLARTAVEGWLKCNTA